MQITDPQFDQHSSSRKRRSELRFSWSAVLFWIGLSLLCWFLYEEANWQLYAHARWGRIEFELYGLKSIVLLVACYLITAGYYLRTKSQAEIANKLRTRLLGLLLLFVSIFFLAMTTLVSWVVLMD